MGTRPKVTVNAVVNVVESVAGDLVGDCPMERVVGRLAALALDDYPAHDEGAHSDWEIMSWDQW